MSNPYRATQFTLLAAAAALAVSISRAWSIPATPGAPQRRNVRTPPGLLAHSFFWTHGEWALGSTVYTVKQ